MQAGEISRSITTKNGIGVLCRIEIFGSLVIHLSPVLQIRLRPHESLLMSQQLCLSLRFPFRHLRVVLRTPRFAYDRSLRSSSCRSVPMKPTRRVLPSTRHGSPRGFCCGGGWSQVHSYCHCPHSQYQQTTACY